MKLNYGEYVFQQLITTDFVQRRLVQILVAISANLINLHIVSILCAVVSVNVYIDFILQIAISVVCSLKIGGIYNFVERFDVELHQLTQYLINNYSIENYNLWKRTIVVGSCIYACIVLMFVEINNWVLFMYILQYAICFLIIEQFEQQRIQKWLKDYQTRPSTKVLTDDPASDFLINSYLSPRNNVLRSQYSRNKPKLISNSFSGSISFGSDKPSYHQGLIDQADPSALRRSVTGTLKTRYSLRRSISKK